MPWHFPAELNEKIPGCIIPSGPEQDCKFLWWNIADSFACGFPARRIISKNHSVRFKVSSLCHSKSLTVSAWEWSDCLQVQHTSSTSNEMPLHFPRCYFWEERFWVFTDLKWSAFQGFTWGGRKRRINGMFIGFPRGLRKADSCLERSLCAWYL